MGALCYTMQLYFDFSGYSDMALGLARMFSIRFPLNFNSPLKATSIIDFWQRWHMTLTRYLTLYLYTPISLAMTRREMRAGKRFSAKKKMTAATFLKLLAVPTIFTMFLAGIWHGSGFQFMLFGLLHGVYLTVNHMWRLFGDGVRKWAVPFSRRFSRLVSAGSVLLVVVSVIVAQVFFRAKSTHDALQIVSSMAGFNGFGHGSAIALSQVGLLALLWAIVWICPNSQEIVGYSPKSEIDHPITLVKKGWLLVRWQPSPGWAVAAAVIFVWALMATVNRTEFLYFQF
jgi:D-alanyl-lipoteichoic acid acyltransferase DltB (MBOAT superfamily)